MFTNIHTHLSQSAAYALVASSTILSLLFVGFFIAEPVVGHGQASDSGSFYIRQTVTGESSFLVPPTDVIMAGDLAGLTGGYATGTTDFVVTSNNSSGYYVEISFEDNGTTEAMIGDTSLSESIRDYGGDIAGEPSFTFTASSASQFAYTVTSLSSSDTDASFLDDASDICNAGGSEQTVNSCWKAPSTAAFQIIDRSTAAVVGATSTLTFSIRVPSAAVPVPVADTYTATATLSLFDK